MPKVTVEELYDGAEMGHPYVQVTIEFGSKKTEIMATEEWHNPLELSVTSNHDLKILGYTPLT